MQAKLLLDKYIKQSRIFRNGDSLQIEKERVPLRNLNNINNLLVCQVIVELSYHQIKYKIYPNHMTDNYPHFVIDGQIYSILN